MGDFTEDSNGIDVVITCRRCRAKLIVADTPATDATQYVWKTNHEH